MRFDKEILRKKEKLTVEELGDIFIYKTTEFIAHLKSAVDYFDALINMLYYYYQFKRHESLIKFEFWDKSDGFDLPFAVTEEEIKEQILGLKKLYDFYRTPDSFEFNSIEEFLDNYLEVCIREDSSWANVKDDLIKIFQDNRIKDNVIISTIEQTINFQENNSTIIEVYRKQGKLPLLNIIHTYFNGKVPLVKDFYNALYLEARKLIPDSTKTFVINQVATDLSIDPEKMRQNIKNAK